MTSARDFQTKTRRKFKRMARGMADRPVMISMAPAFTILLNSVFGEAAMQLLRVLYASAKGNAERQECFVCLEPWAPDRAPGSGRRRGAHREAGTTCRRRADVRDLRSVCRVTTLKAVPFLKHCSDIVPIGRLKWFEETEHGSMDSFGWFKIDARYQRCSTPVHHRGESPIGPGATCGQCGRPFRPLRASARFCSEGCRQRAHRARISVTGAKIMERPDLYS